MSLGRLVVELELRDGQFTGRMTGAQAAVDRLSQNLTSLNSNLARTRVSVHSTLPHLRDLAIVSSSLYSIVAGVNETFGALAKTFVHANSEFERTQTLLIGLSKSLDMGDKLRDAARDLNYLVDTSKSAPFSMKELSNAFVKMRAVNLGDVEGKLRSLTDAIANFGGTDQELHRSTVAIQQMASKGVISMEELRQQLGESIPTAMQSMADGLGMTMGSLVDHITKGKIRAVPAIEAMLNEMEFSMRGSSVRMMQTWSGMTSQLHTNWMLLQKRIGDAGVFGEAKSAIDLLNSALTSEEALKYGNKLGEAIFSATNEVKELYSEFKKNEEVIGKIATSMLGIWAVTKAMKGAGVAASGVGAVMSTLTPRMIQDASGRTQLQGMFGANSIANQGSGYLAQMNSAWRMMSTVPMRDVVQPANFAAGRLTQTIVQMPGAITPAARSVRVLTGAFEALGATLRFLTGPWGMLAATIGIVASQFIDLRDEGEKASEALSDIIKKQGEIDDLAKAGVGNNLLAIMTDADLAMAEKNLESLKSSLEDIRTQQFAKSDDEYIDKKFEEFYSKAFEGISGKAKQQFDKVKSEYLATAQEIANNPVSFFVKPVAFAAKNWTNALFGDPNQERERQEQLKQAENVRKREIEQTENAIQKRKIASFKNEEEEERARQKRIIDKKLADMATEYRRATELIDKQVAKKIRENEKATLAEKLSAKQINDYKEQLMNKLHSDTLKRREEELKLEKTNLENSVADKVATSGNANVKEFFNTQLLADEASNKVNELRANINQTQTDIEVTSDENKKLSLLSNLEKDKEKLEELSTNLDSYKKKMDELLSKNLSTEERTFLADVIGKWKTLGDEISRASELARRYASGDSFKTLAVFEGSTDKDIEQRKKASEQDYGRAIEALAGSSARALVSNAAIMAEKNYVDINGKASAELLNALNNAAKNINGAYNESQLGAIKQAQELLSKNVDLSSMSYIELDKLTTSLVKAREVMDETSINSKEHNATLDKINSVRKDTLKIEADYQKKISAVDFKDLAKYAEKAGRALGVDPKLLLAQSALETGWGRSIVKNEDGSNTYNMFNIRPGKSWTGGVSRVVSSGGEIGRFRSYNSYEESFNDYANFIRSNPRYSTALSNASSPENYILGLQRAGYAGKSSSYAKDVLSIYRGNALSSTASYSSREVEEATRNYERIRTEIDLTKKTITDYETELSNLKKTNPNAQSLGEQKDSQYTAAKESLNKLLETEKVYSDNLSASKVLENETKIREAKQETLNQALNIADDDKRLADELDSYKHDLDLKYLNEKEVANAKLAENGKELYDIDIKQYEASLERKLRDLKQAAGEEFKVVKEKYLQQYIEAKRNDEKIKALEERRTLGFDLARSMTGRNTSLTSRQRAEALLGIDYEQQKQGIMNESISEPYRQEKLSNLALRHQNDLEQLKYDNRNAFQTMMEDVKSFDEQAGDVAAQFTTGFIDGIAELATNGKATFHDFALSIIKDIGTMILKLALLRLAQQAVGLIMGTTGAAESTTSPTASSIAGDGGIGRQLNSNFAVGFATGGTTLLSQNDMLKGGVKNKPHVALFAEAGVPEAFIPMKDGKSIPISLMKNSDGSFSAQALLPNGRYIPASIRQTNFANGGTTNNYDFVGSQKMNAKLPNQLMDFSEAINSSVSKLTETNTENSKFEGTNNVVININVDDKGNSNSNQQSGNKNGDANMWKAMGESVKSLVLKTLAEEKRYGGMIYNGN